MTLRFVSLSVLVISAVSCGRECEAVSRAPSSLCRNANSAAISAGAPFNVITSPALIGGTCAVAVNGSEISLTISGSVCTGAGGLGQSARPVPDAPTLCEIPALDAGSYSISGTNQSFTVPSDGGTPFPACP